MPLRLSAVLAGLAVGQSGAEFEPPAGLEAVREQAAAVAGALELSRERLKPLPRLPGTLDLRVGIQRPSGTPIGDVLFLHGFADRLDNHGPLFDALAAAGLRVVSFDLPGHGENHGLQNSLDLQSFDRLAALAAEVERRTREDAARPLILAGWSTGGLFAVRAVQEGAFRVGGREPRGLLLLAPGIRVYPLVGRHGVVTEGSLTRNPAPPHAGGIPLRNRSPLLRPLFAVRFLWTTLWRTDKPLPPSVPTLLFLGGEREDRYADTPRVKEWSSRQRAAGARILGLQCRGAYHELDNEDDPARGISTGAEVRSAAAAFARSVAAGQAPAAAATATCDPF